MHFALPPRKTSFPPPYARVSAQNSSNRRRKQVQKIGYVVLGLLTLYLLVSFLFSAAINEGDGSISKDSSVLIVTVLGDKRMDAEQVRLMKTNRDYYAQQHGYETFYTNTTTYAHLTDPAPASWSAIPALRQALTLYPDVDYVWYLTPRALIMNTTASLYDHIFAPLPNLMLKDIPVVPPDSVIHTFSHLRPSQAYLIFSHDMDNIAHSSFILRNTAKVPVPAGQPQDTWAQYFLDAWFDPLYRAYAFQKAENHALEHLVQWHPTILAKLVVIDQRIFNSYVPPNQDVQDPSTGIIHKHDSAWQSGDLVVNFQGCAGSRDRDCSEEMTRYFNMWQQQTSKIEDAQNPA